MAIRSTVPEVDDTVVTAAYLVYIHKNDFVGSVITLLLDHHWCRR